MKKLIFFLFMTLFSFVISAQNIGDTITLKAGGKLKDKPEAPDPVRTLEKNTKVILLKIETEYGYYKIITENKEVGYINEIWFELADYTKPKRLTPMERTKEMYGKPDDISEYKSNGYHSITYTYYCAKGRYRSITYVIKSHGWHKDSEHTSDCIK